MRFNDVGSLERVLLLPRRVLKPFGAYVKFLCGLLIAWSVVLCNNARADDITVRFDNPVWAPLSHDYIAFSLNGGSYAAAPATRFQATVLSYSPGLNGLSFVDDVDDFYLYCYDLLQYIDHGQTYVYTVDYAGVRSRTLDWLGAVDYVLNGGTDVWGDPYAWLHPAPVTLNGANITATEVAAAIQIGIWESLYELNSASDLASGTFRATNLDAGTATAWNAFNAERDNSNDLPQATTMLLRSDSAQDQIAGLRPGRGRQNTVPEPGSFALAALALVVAAAIRRKLG